MENERDRLFQDFVADDLLNNRGRLVNCCEEMRYLLDNPISTKSLSKRYLEDLLVYATTFSKFYAKWKGNFSSLDDFPILTKLDLKDHWDEIEVAQYQGLADNCMKYTSGSTGTPFKMVMDRYKHCRWIAGNKVFRELVGVESHVKTIYISGTVADKKIPLERMQRDNVYYIDCKYFDNATFESFLQRLVDEKFETITGISSMLENLARYILDGNAPEWTGNMRAIFSVSERLKDITRETLSKYFGCPVCVLYANEENGVLAVDDLSGNGFRANTADFVFEVLCLDSDEPAKDGEVGRLVITDLFNRAFPIIRYENGDLVAKKTVEDGRVYFTEIAGRQVDALYATDGKMVHYFDSISFLEPYLDIRQFQLIQDDYNRFTWVLNTQNRSYEEMILKESKALFGEDSVWDFVYVDEIPKLRSGKTRMTVCNIPSKTK